jgi:hypothetical protein
VVESESRVQLQPKGKDVASTRWDSRKRGAEVPKKATEAELNNMLDVLQTAEALQAKLAAMPDRLRVPLAKHCATLHGMFQLDQAKTMLAADASNMKAELEAALSAHRQT